MAKVSILVPCFNAAQTINLAMESIARQTLEDFEVVLVDDGSTDNTGQILAYWSERDPRVRVISQRHAGVVSALQNGLANCRAPYIARMDADDWAHPARLECQVNYLDHHPHIDVVGCLVRGFPPEQVREGFRLYIQWINSLITDEDIRREIFVESPFVHPSVVYRRDRVVRAGGYQELGWPEDYDLWLRLYQAGAHFAKIPQVLLDWRERPARLTRTDARYSVENFLRVKAHYLSQGPLKGRDAIIIWGAGMMGRRVSKHLLRHSLPLAGFIDIDPRKIGRTRRGRPVKPPESLPETWEQYNNPALVAAVGARGARPLIRERLKTFGLVEGQDWWCVA